MANAVKNRDGLTAQQADFVRWYVVNGCSQSEAAKLAGYAQPREAAYFLMHSTPHVLAAIHAMTARIICTDGATASAALLLRVVRGDEEGASLKVRCDAAKTLLDRAGHIAPKAREAAPDNEKPTESMSIEELNAFLVEGRKQLADKVAALTDITPSARPDARDQPPDDPKPLIDQ